MWRQASPVVPAHSTSGTGPRPRNISARLVATPRWEATTRMGSNLLAFLGHSIVATFSLAQPSIGGDAFPGSVGPGLIQDVRLPRPPMTVAIAPAHPTAINNTVLPIRGGFGARPPFRWRHSGPGLKPLSEKRD